jgi:hypothetical protein
MTERFAWAVDLAESERDPQKRSKLLETRLGEWSELVRDAAVLATGAERPLRPLRARESARIARSVSRRELVDLALALERWRRDVTETTVSARMLLELLVLRLPYASDVAEAA